MFSALKRLHRGARPTTTGTDPMRPSTPLRHQRRTNFRVRLGQGGYLAINANIDGEQVKGEAVDLSTAGVGGYLYTHKLPVAGKRLAISLMLPGGCKLKTGAEIRYARRQPGRQSVRIGVRFSGLQSLQERQISRFLAAQQRKRRRFDPH